MWLFLGLTGSLVLVLPPGALPGAWAAPLESATAWIWHVAWWAGCAAAALGAERTSANRRFRGLLLFGALTLLALAKWGLAFDRRPAPGIWARFHTQGLRSPHNMYLAARNEAAAPPRLSSEKGWQLHRDALVPPHFINDHSRFNYCPGDRFQRGSLPYLFFLRGQLAYSGEEALVAPNGGTLRVNRHKTVTPPGQPARVKIEKTSKKSVEEYILDFDYATSATTAMAPGPWVMFEKGGELSAPGRSAFWHGFADEDRDSRQAFAKAKRRFFLGQVWNAGLWGVLSILWIGPLLRARQALRRATPGAFWLLPLVLALAVCLPVERRDGFAVHTAASLLLFAAAGVVAWQGRFWVRENRERLLAVLSPQEAGWIAVCFPIVAWTVVGSRFFDSRFPRGFALFPAGIDSLFHYTFSREILAGDWLHRADAPFTRQPFIRYLLAPVLWTQGEGAAWGFHAHWTVFALAGAVLWSCLARLSSGRAWLALAIWLLALPFNDYRVWVPTLFPETWAVFFLLCAFAAVAFPAEAPRRAVRAAAVGGVVLGLAVWTRNNLLAVFPLWLAVLFWREKQRRGMRAGLILGVAFAGAVAAMVGAVATRNTLLAPEAPFSLLISPKRTSADLFQGFQLREIPDEDLESQPFLSKMDPSAARFLEGLRRRPGEFVKRQVDRVLILLGLPAFWEPLLVQDYPKYNAWHLFLWLAIVLRIARLKRRAFGPQAMLCWGVLASQMALLAFTGYIPTGYRILTPVYPFLLFLGVAPGERPWRPLPPDAAADS